MQSVHVQLIFNGDQGPDRSGTEIIEWIKSLIFALSSSAFRPFRYTATLAALSLNSALINVANSVEKNYGRLASRSKQSESVKRGARQDELEKRMSELSGNKEKIDVQIMEFINGYVSFLFLAALNIYIALVFSCIVIAISTRKFERNASHISVYG